MLGPKVEVLSLGRTILGVHMVFQRCISQALLSDVSSALLVEILGNRPSRVENHTQPARADSLLALASGDEFVATLGGLQPNIERMARNPPTRG
jgi:hypothetical protein